MNVQETTKSDNVASIAAEKLADAVRFTLSDHQRLLRKSDVVGFCDDPGMCFEYSESVRCGPCAISQAESLGVATNHSLPFAPEQYRLRRCLAAYKARSEEYCNELEQVVAGNEGGGSQETLASKVQALVRSHLSFLSTVESDPVKRK